MHPQTKAGLLERACVSRKNRRGENRHSYKQSHGFTS
jgi:hypothetical protein